MEWKNLGSHFADIVLMARFLKSIKYSSHNLDTLIELFHLNHEIISVDKCLFYHYHQEGLAEETDFFQGQLVPLSPSIL